jgi:hypothetical protein
MAALKWGSILLCDAVTMVGLRVRDWTNQELDDLSSRKAMTFRYFMEGAKGTFLEQFFMSAVEGIKRRRLDLV